MNDETRPSGISAFEGYTLGRLSAQSQQVLGDAADALGQRLFRPAASAGDVERLLADNEMLRQQLASNQADVLELEGIYARLKSWATQASQILNKHDLIEK